jgi:hypothetical protein
MRVLLAEQGRPLQTAAATNSLLCVNVSLRSVPLNGCHRNSTLIAGPKNKKAGKTPALQRSRRTERI